MKLTYHEHTPDDYDPPFFVPVEESAVGHFKVGGAGMGMGSWRDRGSLGGVGHKPMQDRMRDSWARGCAGSVHAAWRRLVPLLLPLPLLHPFSLPL